MAELEFELTKSGCKAAALLCTPLCVHPATFRGRAPEALTSMEKRRWFCRHWNCTPGDSCPSSSPLSVGEKVLHSCGGSLPRGPSCKSKRDRHQLPSLPLCPEGEEGSPPPPALCSSPKTRGHEELESLKKKAFMVGDRAVGVGRKLTLLLHGVLSRGYLPAWRALAWEEASRDQASSSLGLDCISGKPLCLP